MTSNLVDALILAVFADGKIDTEEAVLLQVFFSNYPEFSDVSRDSFEEAQIKLRNRLQSGKSVSDLIEEIGKNLDESDRNTAFAFAYEICASNFILVASNSVFSVADPKTITPVDTLYPIAPCSFIL